ncbi:indolepyruvate ferredoxin oxidoreductase subunit alpha, partial [Vibrio parahaemolyticus]|nr:indolepyruvate ferredoxin oxidoreductase subunit alpha [Vibrio parahaemolyticus]
AKGPFVIVTKQPCALIKEVQKKRANLYSEVDNEKCTKCKACLRIGCPAISMVDGRVLIDKVQCNGCTVCVQTGPYKAIKVHQERGGENE